MLKILVLVLLAVALIDAHQHQPPKYCYGHHCPSSTVRCKKHEQAENHDEVHVEIYCLDGHDRTLQRHTPSHRSNDRNDPHFHTDTFTSPLHCGGSHCINTLTADNIQGLPEKE